MPNHYAVLAEQSSLNAVADKGGKESKGGKLAAGAYWSDREDTGRHPQDGVLTTVQRADMMSLPGSCFMRRVMLMWGQELELELWVRNKKKTFMNGCF